MHRYDLILLDLQMPRHGRVRGHGSCLKADAADSYLPVLVITAQPNHKLRALQAGAKDFISKPFDLAEVRTRIHNMLEVRLLYKQLQDYSRVLEETVRERTAERSAQRKRAIASLTELASDWYWEQDETGAFIKVSGPVLEMLGIGCGRIGRGCQRCAGDRLEQATSVAELQARIEARMYHSWISYSAASTYRGRLATAIPGERRADVRPVLPLRRLPRNRDRACRTRARTRGSAMVDDVTAA